MSRAKEGLINWDNTRAVTNWVDRQTAPVARGFRCIDDRDIVDPQTGGLAEIGNEMFPGVEVVFRGENAGALNVPGQVAGLATFIHLASGVDADTSFDLAAGYASENGLGNVPNHTDTKHLSGKKFPGCGLKGILYYDSELLGVDPATGRRIVDKVLSSPRQEVTVFTGEHKASAWIESTVTNRSIKQTSREGNIFLVEPARFQAMVEHPTKGLAVYMHDRGVDVTPSGLLIAHNTVVDRIAPKLAPGKPRYTAFPRRDGSIGLSRNGNIPKAA